MSSAVVSTSAALGRPFVFDGEEVGSLASSSRALLDRTAEGGCPHLNLTHKNPAAKISPASITTASRLEIRPAPEMVSSGIPAIDALTGGLPRGCLTEVCGAASSGRTTLLMAALAAATRRGEFCAVVDASDALDPQSAAAAGVELERLLWVRCGDAPQKKSSPQRHRDTEKYENQNDENKKAGTSSQSAFIFDRAETKKNEGAPSLPRSVRQGWGLPEGQKSSEHRLEQVLRATDLLLESGGFGLIVLDLGDVPPQAARRIPLTTWFRFRRAIEHTPTILLLIEQQAIAGSCSSLLLHLEGAKNESAEERRKITAHGASRGLVARGGLVIEDKKAPKGQNEINLPNQSKNPAHAQLFTGLNITAELIRSRLDRKPAHSNAFATKTACTG